MTNDDDRPSAVARRFALQLPAVLVAAVSVAALAYLFATPAAALLGALAGTAAALIVAGGTVVQPGGD